MKEYNYVELAKHYDTMELFDNENVRKFNKLLDKLFGKYKVKSILDLTCGTGAQAIYLSKKGYEVTASDLSEEMISVARKKYKKIKFNQGDMRSAQYGDFDAVITMFNAIGHLSKKDFEIAIKNIARNLKSDGIYLFDIFNLSYMMKKFIDYKFIDTALEKDGKKYVRFNKNRLDRGKGIMSINQEIYIQEGMEKPRVTNESWDMQIYSQEQLKKILNDSGFGVVETMNMDGAKFDKDNSLFILTVARKK